MLGESRRKQSVSDSIFNMMARRKNAISKKWHAEYTLRRNGKVGAKSLAARQGVKTQNSVVETALQWPGQESICL